MGSPLSPVIADFVMRDLETEALNKLKYIVPIYYRYVDDILLASPDCEIINTLNAFNSVHERLQFTLESSENNTINFLNVSITLENNKFTFDLYFKPTFSSRYLNFYSNHPDIHKKSIIYGLVDKTIKLSHPKFHQKNLENSQHSIKKWLSIQILSFIFENINKRIKYSLQNFNN